MASSSGKSTKKKLGSFLHIKVQKGDTLASLARKYDTTIIALRNANHMKNDNLKTGQMLKINGSPDEANNRQQKSGTHTARSN